MEDVNNETVDLEKLQDESPISDEPINPEDTSELQHVQIEQIVQEEPQHHDVDPTENVSVEDGKPVDGIIDSGLDIEDDTSSEPVVADEEAIDTSKPIESVKNVVSNFGGIVARKDKTRTDEKSRTVEHVLEKGKEGNVGEEEANREALQELESINSQIEELKLNLERAHEEESQAKQNSEVAKKRVLEMEEQGKLEDERLASELKCVKEEIEDVQQSHAALSKVKEIEKNVKEMKLELESAQAAFVEAEEKRNEAAMAKEKDKLVWDKELKEVKESMEMLNQRVEDVKDLKGKLNEASEMLESLKSELSGYKESSNDEMKTEVEELKLKCEKIKEDTKPLKVASETLERELEHERSELNVIKQRKDAASADIAVLEEGMEKVKSEINAVQLREKEFKERMKELPMQLEAAAQEAGDAKSAADSARTGLINVNEEAEQASVLERRALSLQEEIQKAKASEKMAMEEYNELTKRLQEPDKQANTETGDLLGQVEVAKEDERVILSKLEEANQELLTRKEVYAHAIKKAEKENQERLVVQQELRKWSDKNEQKREDGDGTKGSLEGKDYNATHEQGQDSQIATNSKESVSLSKTSSPREQEQAPSIDTSADNKHGKKKKKHFFPHLLMLFSKKKASSHTV